MIDRLILGCGNFGGVGSIPELRGQGESPVQARALLDEAAALGIRHFDTAHSYAGGDSERVLGAWLRGRSAEQRSTLRVTTKVGNPFATAPGRRELEPAEMTRQLELSLDRLGLARVHTLLLHAPDPLTPWAEVAEGLERLRERGLFLAWGASNVGEEDVRALLSAAPPRLREAFREVQNEFHFLRAGDAAGLLPLLHREGIAYSAFSPLAGGLLTGKYVPHAPAPEGSRVALRPEPYAEYLTEAGFERVAELRARAAAAGDSLPRAALRFVLTHADTAVLGARTPEQLRALVEDEA